MGERITTLVKCHYPFSSVVCSQFVCSIVLCCGGGHWRRSVVKYVSQVKSLNCFRLHPTSLGDFQTLNNPGSWQPVGASNISFTFHYWHVFYRWRCETCRVISNISFEWKMCHFYGDRNILWLLLLGVKTQDPNTHRIYASGSRLKTLTPTGSTPPAADCELCSQFLKTCQQLKYAATVLLLQFSNMVPDFVITGPQYRAHGPAGYLCAGFWDSRWDFRPELVSCPHCWWSRRSADCIVADWCLWLYDFVNGPLLC